MQYGVAALASAHAALVVQEATHLLVVVSQTSPFEQFAFSVHATHRFDVVLHAGVAPLQADVSAAVHCTQVSVASRPAPAVLHAGVVPVHTVLSPAVHCTQRFVVVSQTGSAVLVQSLFCAQATQRWVVVSHTLALPVQSVLAMHCTQLFVVLSQTGAPGAMHSLLFRHWTQMLSVVLQ